MIEMTRESLADLLRARGFDCALRDWSWGESVRVARKVEPLPGSPIMVLHGMTHVKLIPDGGWTMMTPIGSDLDFPSRDGIVDELVQRLGDPLT